MMIKQTNSVLRLSAVADKMLTAFQKVMKITFLRGVARRDERQTF